MIVAFYGRTHARDQLGNLTMNMFCDASSPHASAPSLSTVKGAECKSLALALADIFPNLVRPGFAVDAHVAALLAHVRTYYRCLENKEPVLPPLVQKH